MPSLFAIRNPLDAKPLFAQAAYGIPHSDAALWIEACTRLIEKQHLGMMRNGASDLDTLRKSP